MIFFVQEFDSGTGCSGNNANPVVISVSVQQFLSFVNTLVIRLNNQYCFPFHCYIVFEQKQKKKEIAKTYVRKICVFVKTKKRILAKNKQDEKTQFTFKLAY